MANIGRLGVKIDADTGGLTLGLQQASERVESFKGRVSQMSDALDFAGKAAGALTTVLAGAGLAGQIIAVQRQFDVLNASLITVTGSTQNAASAFEWIQRFASTTPYQLEEVTGAFIKMKALGLNASEDALRSYGNTASAMGKGLDQMIEAVADAATGEFERLKEFGIKSRKEGDNVTFTFRGVETTIRASSENIVNYLRRIGDEDFAGAMNERVKTLDGSISNLADSYNKLLLTISKGGFGQTVSREIGALSNDMTALSDEMEASAKRGDGAFMQLANGAGILAGRATFGALQTAANVTNTAINFLTGGVLRLNENVNLMPTNLLPAAAQMEVMTGKLKQAKVEYDVLAARLAQAPDNIYIKSELNQLGIYINKLEEATKKQRLMQSAMASIEGLDFSAENAKFLRQQKVPRQQPPAPPAPPKPSAAGGGGAPKESRSIFDDGDPVANEIAKRAEAWREAEAKAADAQDQAQREGLMRRVEALKEYTKTEEQLTQERQAKQLSDLQIGLDNGLLTEQEYMLMRQDMEFKHMDELARIRGDGMKKLQDISQMSWNDQLALTVGKIGEMTAASASGSKAMFNINKAAAIANALLKAKESVTSAYAFGSKIGGPPLGAAMAGLAAAATAAQIGAIRSQQFGGGGSVSAGGGSSTVPTQTAAASGAGMAQTITIQGVSSGDLFSGDAVRTLIDRLIDAQRNGARIVLA